MQSSSQNTKQPPVPLLLVVLMVILVASTVAVAVFGWDYYRSTTELRMLSPEHKLFKASGTVGIACGIVATVLFITNLFYLPRRRFVNALRFFGSLRSWLSWHVISGFTGGAIVFLHAAFQVKSPVGTALVWSLGIVLCTGVVGRYLLRFIPRCFCFPFFFFISFFFSKKV